MSAALVRANALALPLRAESVDLIVTSPPYFALRSYRDGGEHFDGQLGSEPTPQDFLEALWAVTRECVRVLKPTGSMFVNLGDKYAGSSGHNNNNVASNASSTLNSRRSIEKNAADRRNAPNRYNQASGKARAKSLMGLPWRYAIGCIDDLGLILRAEIVWDKPNGLPEPVKDRVRRSHEQWFHLTKEPRYFAAVDEIREPQKHGVINGAGANRNVGGGSFENAGAFSKEGGFNDYRKANGVAYNPLGRTPGSVWSIASEPLRVPDWLAVDHFAAFPQEWPRRLINGWSPSKGVVLDPFGGTGTVAMVARALGRMGVSVDLSADYLRLAQWRVFESGNARKSAARTDRERQGVFAF